MKPMLTTLSLLFACLHSLANPSLAAERPNILLILPDQMRASAMGCDGNAAAGYRTGFIGNWHLDSRPRDPGLVPSGPEASCDFAFEFLQSQPKDQPFFLTVQMGPTPWTNSNDGKRMGANE